MVVAGIRPRRYAWRAMAEGGDRIALIEAIYGAALEPGRWPLVMKALGDHFDGAAASMLMLDDSGGGCRFVARVGILGEPEMVERYRTYYGRLDPWPAELTRQGVGAVMQTSAVFDPDDPRAAAFVNEYFLPAGLVDSMGAALLHDEHRFALAAIQRSRQRGIFLDRDRQRLAALVPHLRTALRVHRQLAGTGAGAAAEVALDHLTVGVLTVDHAGRVVHANKAARDVLARGDGLFIEQDRSLAAFDRAANDVLQRLVAAAIQPAPGAGGALRLTRGEGGATATRRPGAGARQRDRPAHRPRAVDQPLWAHPQPGAAAAGAAGGRVAAAIRPADRRAPRDRAVPSRRGLRQDQDRDAEPADAQGGAGPCRARRRRVRP